MEMGHIIAKYRMQKGISQKDLAKSLNVSTSTVALWEVNKRNPTPTTLVDIADFFNISMDILFSADRKNKSYQKEETNLLSPDCERLISYFNEMNGESREILLGEARKLLREERLEEKREAKQATAKMA
jgi:transcriptional regulator with XRE-family HTH domain